MTTWSVSLRTRTVVMMTNIEKTNVQMGSANLYSSPSCNNKTANEILRLYKYYNLKFPCALISKICRSQTFANICHYKYNGYIFTGGDVVGWGFERFIGLDWSMYQTCTEYICYVYLPVYIHKYYISERFPFMRCSISIVLHRSHFNVSLKIPVVCSDNWWTIFLVYYKFTLPDWSLRIRWRRMVIHLGQ